MEEMSAKYATLTDKGIRIEDESILEKLNNKMLSASLVTGMLNCPAQWVSGSILPLFIEQDEDNAMTRGSFFHRLMEYLFAEDKDNRGIVRTKELVSKVLAESEFAHFSTNKDALSWLDDAIDNYFAMGSKPETVSIANYQDKGGIEVRIIGDIEGCKRQFHGFIDRLSYAQDGNLIIDDWKTGAKAKRYIPGADKYETGWSEARQQILYAYIINKDADNSVNNASSNENPRAKKARLVFPVARKVVPVDVNNQDLIDKALQETKKAEEKFNQSCADNLFTYEQSFLCHWCPLVKACPGAMKPVRRVEKARDAYDSQPDKVELAKGLNF